MSHGLHCRGVTAAFERSGRGVFDVTLSVLPGECLALLGGNGAGKTTVINLCLGLLRPERGSIHVAGIDVVAEPIEAKRHIAYVPEVARLYSHLNALENICFFEQLNGSVPPVRAVLDALALLSFPEEAAREPLRTYSKGMRQKVLIAMGLVKRASVFLLDEPTSGLDPTSTRQLLQVVEALRSRGAAIVISSHDAHEIGAYADRIALLRDGRLACERTARGLTFEEIVGLYES
ncbi:MAG: ABC transporter ATP-binding protein [Acidobacteriota bacterium]